jgi:spore maturation protein CgeB
MEDVKAAGCNNVVFVPFAYKPTVHYPDTPENSDERRRFACDVAFVGTCDKDRFPYFTSLMTSMPTLHLKLFGSYWDRIASLKPYYAGFAAGREFRLAVSGAKVSVNLVRRANRDGHVMRSFEIPACHGFMLAERTAEHLEFLSEGRDMACFSSFQEFRDKIEYYLSEQSERVSIARAGHMRVTTGEHTYKDRLATVLDLVEGLR